MVKWGKCGLFGLLIMASMILVSTRNAYAQGDISLVNSTLAGATLSNPTSLQFGPDGRLYVSQQDGVIYAYTIIKSGVQSYQVVNTETINLINTIPNHDDDGNLNTSIVNRQITGILVVGTPSNPILWVSSSDPRIGGGGTGGDSNLDTNSGVISKLTWNGSSWTKVDVVKGLPRSEENHSTNGMQLDAATNILYVASGGNTNAGSPSNNFAFLTEYALSAAILEIDLDQIQSSYGGSYTIPTLDDPDRANLPDGTDPGDPWGGNDGLNQGKIVIGGPVQIHSPGYRNAYDIVLTETPGIEGRLYTIDNGANGGWGGHPDNEGDDGTVTNNYVIGEPGSNGAGPNDDKVNNKDNLHLVSKPGMTPIYGGHPTPIRANPTGAGLYWYDNDTATPHFDLSPTADWPPVPPSLANPVEGDFQNPGVDDGAMRLWSKSTNGMVEFRSANAFGGAMEGDLLAVSFNNTLFRMKLNPSGTSLAFSEAIAAGFANTPLDVTAQPDGQIFAGTIWVCNYVSNSITIFEEDTDETWEYVSSATSNLESRHENSAVEVNGKFYVLGGRGIKPIDIYDPSTDTWTKGAQPPMEIHHFQAVTFNNKIYVAGGFTGSYPSETPLANILIYDPATNSWSTGDAISRPRGAAGAAVYNGSLYLFGGMTNGHTSGWVNWVDKYALTTGTWTTLANLPRNRDHFAAAIAGTKVYLAGGRETNKSGNVYGVTIGEVDVYDIQANSWTTLAAQVPTKRAGAATAVLNGEIYLIGGESGTQVAAHNETEALDPFNGTWRTTVPLNTGRHGTHAIVYNNAIYIPSGSGNRGAGPELNTMEKYSTSISCSGVYSASLDEDNDNYTNADELENGTSPCNASSIPTDNDLDYISDLNDPDDDNDGIIDSQDLFALDASNGLNLTAPIIYPFLNGDPGTGLFGLGFTGLMSNGVDDYATLYDDDDDNLIMGGAVGLASAPSSLGSAQTNDLTYAFQFGFKIEPSQGAVIIESRLQGDPFFDGIAIGSLDNQTQGIYFGTGDQDNYVKIALDANNGTPGIRIIGEHAGTVFVNNFTAVSGILNAGIIDFFIVIDPSSGTASFSYSTPSGGKVNLPGSVVLPAGFNNLLSGSAGTAVGIFAESGDAPTSFSATWDYMYIQPGSPYIENNQSPYSFTAGSTNGSINLNAVFADDKGDGNLTYSIISIGSNTIIQNTALNGGMLDLTFNDGAFGSADFVVRATDSDGLFADYSFEVILASPTVSLYRINAGGNQYTADGITWEADNSFSGGSSYNKNIPIAQTTYDPLFQSERYGNFTYSIDVPSSGYYKVELFFAELYWDIDDTPGANSRLFDVVIEGNQVLDDFDIFTEAGGAAATAISRSFEFIEVTDGTLNINFTTVADNAKLSALHVSAYSAGSGDAPIVQNPGDQTFTEGQTVNLQIEATDAGPLTYDAIGLPASLLIDQNTGLITGTIEVNADTYPVTITVTDEDDNFSIISFDINIIPNSSQFSMRINAGGGEVNTGGFTWIADNYNGGGSTYSTTAAIANTTNDVLYQSERFMPTGPLVYNIPVPAAGEYLVVLHFAEIYYNVPGGGTGTRIFNINVEDQELVGNFNISQEAGGGNIAVSKSFSAINVNDGFVTITMTSVQSSPKISAIEIIQSSAAGVPMVNAGPDKTLVLPQNSTNLSASASDPDGGSIQSYLWTQESGPSAATLSGTSSPALSVSNLQLGEYVFRITVTDDEGTSNYDEVKVTVVDLAGSWTLRINSGGDAVTHNGEQWIADAHFVNGSKFDRTYAIANTTNDDVFNSERYTGLGVPLNYEIPVPADGNYDLALSFAELYFGGPGGPSGGTGLRVMDVYAEGMLILDDYDITENAGAALTAVTEVIENIPVNDGALTLSFVGIVDVPKVNGIFISGSATTTWATRINSGGPAINLGGNDWIADTYHNGGNTYSNTTAIANTTYDALYQTERYNGTGNLQYNIPVPGADTYTVILHFAEIWYNSPGGSSSGGPGSRVFDITVEGAQMKNDYDIIVAAGGSVSAIQEVYNNIPVNDGTLNIVLSPEAGSPKLSGIEVISGSGSANVPPIVNAGADKSITLPTNSTSFTATASDPDGGSIVSYSWIKVSGPTATLANANTATLNLSNLVEGTYVFSVTVTDDEGQTKADQVMLTVQPQTSGAWGLRINSGGAAISYNSNNWIADQYFTNGTKYDKSFNITGTDNNDLYNSERYNSSGPLVYEIPVPSSGNYDLELNFAELYFGAPNQPAGAIGVRVFDVYAEGNLILDNYDVFKEAGGSLTAVNAVIQGIPVSDGSLSLSFQSVVDVPKVNGIFVSQSSGGSSTWSSKINVGGPSVTIGTNQWVADTYFTGNTKTYSKSIAIANTTADVLYQTERYALTGALTYNVPVPANGAYTVILHYAELWYGVPGGGSSGGVGSRLINVSIENSQVETNYDIVLEAGGSATAVQEIYNNINVNDGILSISFSNVLASPKVNAIEVISESTLPSIELPDLSEFDDEQITVYPNPFQDVLKIDVKSNNTVRGYRVFDVSGNEVYVSFDDSKFITLDMSDQPSGLYIIILYTSDGTRPLRVLKN